jgi:hypothetical protein
LYEANSFAFVTLLEIKLENPLYTPVDFGEAVLFCHMRYGHLSWNITDVYMKITNTRQPVCSRRFWKAP